MKNDPFSESFGNHPIHLPWDGSDLLNAARWLADMGLRFPVSDAERRKVPLFPSHSATEPLITLEPIPPFSKCAILLVFVAQSTPHRCKSYVGF